MRFREGQPSHDGFGSEANDLAEAYEALSRRVAEARAEQRLFTLDGGYQMAELAFHHLLQVYQNLSVPELVEHALMRGEGGLSQEGALCVKTVPHTVRSPCNTLIVGLSSWANTTTAMPRPLSVSAFRHLYQEMQAYVQGRSLYVTDGEIAPGIRVRIVTELASQALFAQQLLQPSGDSSSGDLSSGDLSSGDLSSGDSSSGDSLDASALHESRYDPRLDELTHELTLNSSAQSVLNESLEQSPHGSHAVAQSSGVESDGVLIPGLPPPSLPITLIVLPGVKGEPSLEQELPGEVFTALYPAHQLALIGGSRNCEEIRMALAYLLEQPLLDRSVLPLDPTVQVMIADASASQPVDGSASTSVSASASAPTSASTSVSLSLVFGLPDTFCQHLNTDTSWGQRFVSRARSLGAEQSPSPLSPRSLGWFPDRIATITSGWYGNVSLGDRPDPICFASLLENVILDPKTGRPDMGDRRWSETPNAACPAPTQSWIGSVNTLIFCLFDPLGVFPSLARLTLAQAQYYYLCGYSNWGNPSWMHERAEDNAEDDAEGSFRACFTSEITIPQAIARMQCLGDRLSQSQPQIFLVNTAATWSEARGLQRLGDQQLKEQLMKAMRWGGRSPQSRSQLPFLDARLLAQQLGHSPQRQSLAEALFQRFENQMQRFKGEIPRSIYRAGPRL